MSWARTLRLLKRLHWVMLIPILLALGVGVFFIYSACYISHELPVQSFYKKQGVWIALGFLFYFIAALYDYRRLGRWSWVLYGGSLILLVLVLVAGKQMYGARRWLMIPGTGFGVQPSELAKLATLVFLAYLLSRPELDLSRFSIFAALLGVVALPLALVLKQPDLGTSVVFVPPALIMMYIAGVPLRYVGTLVMIGVVVVALTLAAIILPDQLELEESTRDAIQRVIPLTEYQQDRVAVLLWPDRDPLGAGWNKNQSMIAVGSGGMLGKGYLQGTQNILGFLPRLVAPTDFIYSVIAEEMGFVGSVCVIVLFLAIMVLGLQVAAATPDRMGRLLCVGVVAMLFCHVWINIAMTVGVMPITGLPLPLLSYGGSFVLTTLAALGIVQSVYIRSPRRIFG